MSAFVVSAVVRDGRIHITDDFYRARAGRAAKKWGDGACLSIRIEPEEEAQKDGQRRHYFGHIVQPLSDWNGDFMSDWHLLLKAAFMPGGKTSLTQLNYEETREFTLQCEVYAHTAHPEAFALYDRRTA